ncbi:uncharacterized protein LOC106666455 [Cimex lectularius]|uniref:Regulatory protein zeste n=1 Tax=Cimex lectularius TaxID=79782 RepID=A0A8I6RS49_CIMLE|nr:uncharacterized protein LOC106666455 [Cimex lectularius]
MSKRAPNFSQLEEQILTKLVLKFASILENKKTDAVTTRKKSVCWEKITGDFNTTPGCALRSAVNLKCKYENLKKKRQWRRTHTGSEPEGNHLRTSPSMDRTLEEILECHLKEKPHQSDDAEITNIQVTPEVESCFAPKIDHVMSTNEVDISQVKVEPGSSNQTESDWTDDSVDKARNLTPTFQKSPRKHQWSDIESQSSAMKASTAETTKALQEELFHFRKQLLLEEHELQLKHMREKHSEEMKEQALKIKHMCEKHGKEMKILRKKNELCDIQILTQLK